MWPAGGTCYNKVHKRLKADKKKKKTHLDPIWNSDLPQTIAQLLSV